MNRKAESVQGWKITLTPSLFRRVLIISTNTLIVYVSDHYDQHNTVQCLGSLAVALRDVQTYERLVSGGELRSNWPLRIGIYKS